MDNSGRKSANAVDSDEINIEEYNQVDPESFDCFPRRELPLDLYQYKEEINVLVPLYRGGTPFSERLRREARALSEAGQLFFCRNQQARYVDCLSSSLDVAVEDPNLSSSDVADIFAEQLVALVDELFANPSPDVLEMLGWALDLLAVFVGVDSRNAAHLAATAHRHRTRQRQRVNASLVAVALYCLAHDHAVAVDDLSRIALGFFLYDLGMSKVSRLLTDKTQQLRPDEKRRMQEHSRQGVEIANRLGLTGPEIEEPIMQHHERLDGSGYPGKLKGEAIGELGRIMAVADSYMAMITDRPHCPGRDPAEAAAELIRKDRAYDSDVSRGLVSFLKDVTF